METSLLLHVVHGGSGVTEGVNHSRRLLLANCARAEQSELTSPIIQPTTAMVTSPASTSCKTRHDHRNHRAGDDRNHVVQSRQLARIFARRFSRGI